MEVVYQKYKNQDLEIIGLDSWDGSIKEVKGFIEKTGVTFPVLLNATDYIKNLETIDNRGTYFIINQEGVVIASCDDGYKSLDCFKPEKLDSVVGNYFSHIKVR